MAYYAIYAQWKLYVICIMKRSAWRVSAGSLCQSDPFKMSVEQTLNDTEDDKSHLIKGLTYFNSIFDHWCLWTKLYELSVDVTHLDNWPYSD